MELLVESLDNANDLKPLGLWPQIVKHFTSSEPEVVVQALWVCGTAVQVRGKVHLSMNSKGSSIGQNNPKSQEEVCHAPLHALGADDLTVHCYKRPLDSH
jgi:hypothetical protein